MEMPMQEHAAKRPVVRSREEILRQLQELLKTVFNLESVAALPPEARFREDLQSDSMAMVDIVIEVEEAFGIKLRSDLNFFEEIRTVGDAVDLIYRQQGLDNSATAAAGT
jgi:acyl carrier protein